MKNWKPIIVLFLLTIVSLYVLASCNAESDYNHNTETEENKFSVDVLKEHVTTEKGYDLVIDYQNRVFKVSYDKDSILEDDIFGFIEGFFFGQDQIIKAIEDELGESATPIIERFNTKIYFLISLKSVDEWNTNYAEPGSNKVHLFGKTGLNSIYHEFMHIIFGDCQIPWASEANAMYWPTYVDLDYYKDSLDRFYNNLGENINLEYEKAIEAADIKERLGIEAEYQIVQKWNEIYEKNKALPKTYEEFDYKIFTESVGAACLLNHGNIARMKGRNIISTSVGQEVIKNQDVSRDPNSFNYYESYLLLCYIIEKNGMESFVQYYNGEKDFKEAFGESYEEAYDAFMKWTEEKYNN